MLTILVLFQYDNFRFWMFGSYEPKCVNGLTFYESMLDMPALDMQLFINIL